VGGNRFSCTRACSSVKGGAPASLHGPRYVQWCSRVLGCPRARFAQGVASLAHALPTHELLRMSTACVGVCFARAGLQRIDRTARGVEPEDVTTQRFARPTGRAMHRRQRSSFAARAILESPYYQRLPLPLTDTALCGVRQPRAPKALRTPIATVEVNASRAWPERPRVSRGHLHGGSTSVRRIILA
jgi:hypothetical protein